MTTEALQTRSELPTELAAYMQLIEKAANSPEVDADKLSKLLDMQERILKRGAEAAFNAAFAEMQSEMPEIDEAGKIKVGEQVRSTYSKFEDINKVMKPILQKHGFAIMFKTASKKGEVTVTGILVHREGHRESTELTLEADTSGSKNGVQSTGSSVQYGKRYVMAALLNITTRGEDDDGKKAGTKTITEKEVADLRALAEEVKADIPKFCQYYKIDKIENLPASLYQSAVKAFEKKRRQA